MLDDVQPRIHEGETEIEGRKYLAKISADFEGSEGGSVIVIGPPEGLVDMFGLPKQTADRLHNALYERRIFTYRDASNVRVMQGILQEVLSVDAQKIVEAFFNYEKETT